MLAGASAGLVAVPPDVASYHCATIGSSVLPSRAMSTRVLWSAESSGSNRRRMSAVGRDPRQWDAQLHAALHFHERELHVDRRGKLGLVGLQPLEFDDFAGLRSRRARNGWNGFVHRRDCILSVVGGRWS